MHIHPDYLSELERGKLTPIMGIHKIVASALGATREEEMFLMQDIDEKAETEAWTRYAISMYFGRSLWTFYPEVSYEESVNPFVQALIGLDKNGQRATASNPTIPSLSSMIKIEEEDRRHSWQERLDVA